MCQVPTKPPDGVVVIVVVVVTHEKSDLFLKGQEGAEVVLLADRHTLGSQDGVARVEVKEEVGQAVGQDGGFGRRRVLLAKSRSNNGPPPPMISS